MRGVKSTCSWLIDADCTSYHRARCKRGQNSFDVSNMGEAVSSIQYDEQNTQDGCQRWRAGNNNLFVQVKLRIPRCSPHIEWRSCLSGTVNVACCRLRECCPCGGNLLGHALRQEKLLFQEFLRFWLLFRAMEVYDGRVMSINLEDRQFAKKCPTG